MSWEISSPELFESALDWSLTSYDLNEEWNKFAVRYYSSMDYYDDVSDTFPESIYFIKDNKKNFEKISDVISKRFNDWNKNEKA